MTVRPVSCFCENSQLGKGNTVKVIGREADFVSTREPDPEETAAAFLSP